MKNTIDNPAVALIIENERNEFLLQYRSFDAVRYPNKWGFFGGRALTFESPIKALYREIWEELRYIPRRPYLYMIDIGNHNGSQTLYFFHERFDCCQTLNLNEGERMDWFTIEQILNLPFSPKHQFVIDCLHSNWKF